MATLDTGETVLPTSRSEALIHKVKYYHGSECPAHRLHFIRYTETGYCTLCESGSRQKRSGRVKGYIAKRADALAFRHPVSPWPITASNMHLCPDLSTGRHT